MAQLGADVEQLDRLVERARANSPAEVGEHRVRRALPRPQRLPDDRVVELEVDRPGLADEFNTLRDLDRWRDFVALRVRVRLFAVARERAGQGQIEVLLPPSPRVADLRKAIGDQYPALTGLAAKIMIAVDSDFADDDRPISAGAELALIPPVSGG